jgi:HEAT repeat protein
MLSSQCRECKIIRKAAILLLLILSLMVASAAGDEKRALTEKERVRFDKAFKELGSEVYKKRKAAAEEIERLGPPVLDLLKERKDNPDPEVQEAVERLIRTIKLDIARRRIIRLIKETGIDDNPDEILKKYTSSKEEDRVKAFLYLTMRHTAACVPIVKEFLEDPSDKIVDMAISELRHVVKRKDLDIAQLLLKVVNRSSPKEERMLDRINFFLSFADYREKSLVDALANLSNSEIQKMVYTRMVLIPEESFVFAFAVMLDNEDRFMRRFCTGGIEVVVREVLQKNRRVMFSFNKPDMQRLSRLLAPHLDSKDPIVVQVVTGAIGRTGVGHSADKLINLLNSKDIVTVRRAAISLGLMKAKKAAPALVEILKKGNYEALPECMDSLARIKDPASFTPLLKLLKKKGVPFRSLLLYAMAKVDLKRSAEELPEFLSDPDVHVRSLAVDGLIRALEKYPGLQSRKIPDLLQIVREGKQVAKTAAARVLGEVGGISILPDLKKLSDNDDPQVRSTVLAPIAMIAQSGARKLLKEKLKDNDYQVRVSAGQALGYLGDWSDFLKVRLIPLELKGYSVVDALRRIALATGINLVIDPGAVRMCSLDTRLVIQELKGKTIQRALDIFKEEYELSWDSSHYVLFATVRARKDILSKFILPTAGLGCSKADLAVEKKLSGRLTCDAISERVENFFDSLSAKTDIKFEMDKSIDRRLAESLRSIDLSVSDIPIAELLRLVLAPRRLSAKIEAGKIVVSPEK